LTASNGGDEAALFSQLEIERAEIEAIACEKYNNGRVSVNGLIVIEFSDIAGLIS
jgi:hypothetical protein